MSDSPTELPILEVPRLRATAGTAGIASAGEMSRSEHIAAGR